MLAYALTAKRTTSQNRGITTAHTASGLSKKAVDLNHHGIHRPRQDNEQTVHPKGGTLMKRMTFLEIMMAVHQERLNQIEKWGSHRKLHPDTWVRVMAEELGEIANEIEDDSTGENITTELVQLAALCFAWLSGDEPPLQEELNNEQPMP